MDKGRKYTIPCKRSVTKQKYNKKHLEIKGGAFRVLAFSSLIILLALGVFTIQPLYFKVADTEATDDEFTQSIITFESISSVASVNLNVSDVDGSFATSKDDQKASFSVATNNYTGYTLTIRSNSESTDLTDGDNKLESILDAVSYDDFSSTGRIGRALNNRWGYLPNYYRDGNLNVENSDVYLPAPTEVATILRVTDTANSKNGVDGADVYTIGLGVRADYTNPKGVYTFSDNGGDATFVLEYVANPVNYIVNYADNTGDSDVTNLPETQAGNTDYDSINISDEIPIRSGFEFIGWCTVEPVVVDGVNECVDTENNSGIIYLPGDQYIINKNTANEMTLYALWNMEEVDETEVVEDESEKTDENVLLYDLFMELMEEEKEDGNEVEELGDEETKNDEVEDEVEGDDVEEPEDDFYYVKIGDDEEEYTCWKIVEITDDEEIKVEYYGDYDKEVGVCINVEKKEQNTEEQDIKKQKDLFKLLSHDTLVLSGDGVNDNPWVITEYQIYEDIVD